MHLVISVVVVAHTLHPTQPTATQQTQRPKNSSRLLPPTSPSRERAGARLTARASCGERARRSRGGARGSGCGVAASGCGGPAAAAVEQRVPSGGERARGSSGRRWRVL